MYGKVGSKTAMYVQVVDGDGNPTEASASSSVTVVPIASRSTDVQAVVATAGLVLRGFDVTESAGTAAEASCVLRHRTADTAPALCAPINLDANGCTGPKFFAVPIPCASGVFLEVVTGSVTVVLYTDS